MVHHQAGDVKPGLASAGSFSRAGAPTAVLPRTTDSPSSQPRAPKTGTCPWCSPPRTWEHLGGAIDTAKDTFDPDGRRFVVAWLLFPENVLSTGGSLRGSGSPPVA